MSPLSTPELLLELYAYRAILDWRTLDQRISVSVCHSGIRCTMTIEPSGLLLLTAPDTCRADVLDVLTADHGQTVTQIEDALSDRRREWSRASIVRVLGELVAAGLVTSPGRGRKDGYRLATPPAPQ